MDWEIIRKYYAHFYLIFFCLIVPTSLFADQIVVPLKNLVITAEQVEKFNDEVIYLHPRIGLKDQRKAYPIFHDSHPDGVCALIETAVNAKSFLDTNTFENGSIPKLRKLTRYNISKSYFNYYSVELTEETCDGVDTDKSYDIDYYLVSRKGLIIDKYVRKTCGERFPKSYKSVTCKKR